MAYHRILKVPAVVYGVSVEPMLGPITLPNTLMDLGNRAWVIVGGESGRTRTIRTSRIEWFRDIRDQCIQAGVPFHLKQWGLHNSDLMRIGKKASGRMLDRREWDEFPFAADEVSSIRRFTGANEED